VTALRFGPIALCYRAVWSRQPVDDTYPPTRFGFSRLDLETTDGVLPLTCSTTASETCFLDEKLGTGSCIGYSYL
jgi:hypothetical protein